MKTILVATDFSPASLNAADYAASMALTINAGILVLHVYQVPVSYSEIPVVLNEENMLENIEKKINDLKTSLTSKTGGQLTVDTEILLGIFSRKLKTVCEKINRMQL